MRVKIFFGSDCRVYRGQTKFEPLKKFVEKTFPQLGDDFLLTFEDDEGDLVTIDDDEGFTEAVELAEEDKKRSVKIIVGLRTLKQRIEEPGAPEKVESLDSGLPKGEEIVSEPGGGLKSETKMMLNKVEDALDIDFVSTPLDSKSRKAGQQQSSSIRSDQVEGSPPKQSIQYWIVNLLPLLGEHGVVDELKAAIPELFRSIEKGDDIGTAVQTMIALCPLLLEQAIVQEFMNHVQTNVAPFTGDIVPHLLRLEAKGLVSIVERLASISMQWKKGVQNLRFDVTPFLRTLCPQFVQKMEKENQLPGEMDLAKISLSEPKEQLQVGAGAGATESKVTGPTPFGGEHVARMESKHRLMAVDQDWDGRESKRSWRGRGKFRGSRFRRFRGRGSGSAGYHNSPRQDWYSGYYGPPSQPYFGRPSGAGHYQEYDDVFSRTQTWDQGYSTRIGPPSHSMQTHGQIHSSNKSPRFSSRFDFPGGNRRSANRLEAKPETNQVRVSATPLKAEFVDHVNIPLRSKYLPGQRLLKKWCVRNVGADNWDDRVKLKYTKGDDYLPTKLEFPVPTCKSAQACELSAMIETPAKPGRYTAYFRLTRGDTQFGPRIWVDIHVVATESELTEDDEQTQKRLDRLDNPRKSQTRSSLRRSQQKSSVRSSQRATKTRQKRPRVQEEKTEMQVFIPEYSAKMTKTSSTLNKDATAFVPKAQEARKPPPEEPKKPVHEYESQIKELRAMGMNTDEDMMIYLLKLHKGDVSRVSSIWLQQQQKFSTSKA